MLSLLSKLIWIWDTVRILLSCIALELILLLNVMLFTILLVLINKKLLLKHVIQLVSVNIIFIIRLVLGFNTLIHSRHTLVLLLLLGLLRSIWHLISYNGIVYINCCIYSSEKLIIKWLWYHFLKIHGSLGLIKWSSFL